MTPPRTSHGMQPCSAGFTGRPRGQFQAMSGDVGGGVGVAPYVPTVPAEAVAVPQNTRCLALDMDGTALSPSCAAVLRMNVALLPASCSLPCSLALVVSDFSSLASYLRIKVGG